MSCSKLCMFEYLKKFQLKYRRKIFDSEEEILEVDVEHEYDNREGESSVRLYHTNGLCMNVIYYSKTDHVQIRVERIACNTEDWIALKDAAVLWNLWNDKSAAWNKDLKYRLRIFDEDEEIYKVDVENEYENREGESAVRLYHMGGLRTIVIYYSDMDHVQIKVERTAHNTEDWHGLKNAAVSWNEKKCRKD